MQLQAKLFSVMILAMLYLPGCSGGSRVVVVREPEPIPAEVAELENLRKEVNERTHYGKGETKSWNERYSGENTGRPFQGSAQGYNRRSGGGLQ